MPPETITVYFDDVVIHAKVIRALRIENNRWECLIRIGDRLKYDYVDIT